MKGTNFSAVTTDVSVRHSTAMEKMIVEISLMSQQLVVRYKRYSSNFLVPGVCSEFFHISYPFTGLLCRC